jgi:PAS domain S-box-containing protein
MTHLLDSTQQRLESAETSKELLMADSETSIMVVDEDLRVLEINKALLNLTKASREGTIGRPCHWAVKKSFEPCYEKGQTCLVREVLTTGRATHTVQEDVRSDGSSKWFTVSAYPLKADTRGKRSVLVIWRDVTKGISAVLTRQERDIREDFAHILHQDKMTALGKLAAAAVHEINNPIQGILTFAQLMRSSLDGPSLPSEELERFRNYLDMIAAESARCGKILMNLLSFSRQGEVKKTAVDLRRVFDEVLLLLGNRLELAGVSVDLEFEEDIPSIFGDRDQMKQAVLNLMLNAMEAMPEGGSITIKCRLRPLSGSVEISVADTGTGVPADIQARIFEPFFSTKQTGKGLGLGLSVVYGIVARHGGTIEFESREGKGAIFVLTLPIEGRTDEDGNDGVGSTSGDPRTG